MTGGFRSLFEVVGEPIELPAVKRFTAEEFGHGSFPIRQFGPNFQRNFFPVVDENVRPIVARRCRLLQSCQDGLILATFGGRTIVRLAHISAFMERWHAETMESAENYGFLFYAHNIRKSIQPINIRGSRNGGAIIESYAACLTPYNRDWNWFKGCQVVARSSPLGRR